MNAKITLMLIGFSFAGCYSLGYETTSDEKPIRERSSIQSYVPDRENMLLMKDLIEHPQNSESMLTEIENLDSSDVITSFNAGSILLSREDFEAAKQHFFKAIDLLAQYGMPCFNDTGRTSVKFLSIKKTRAPSQGQISVSTESDALPVFKSYLLGNVSAADLIQEIKKIENRKIGESRFHGGAGLFLQFVFPYGAPPFDPLLAIYPSIADNVGKRKIREELFAYAGLTLFLSKDIAGMKEWRKQISSMGLNGAKIETLSLVIDWLSDERIEANKFPSIPKLLTFLGGQ